MTGCAPNAAPVKTISNRLTNNRHNKKALRFEKVLGLFFGRYSKAWIYFDEKNRGDHSKAADVVY